MKPQRFIAKLTDKTDFNEKFTKYVFELDHPNEMEFESGQYVSITVDEHGDRRSYSICSNSDTKHSFELLIEHLPDGVGSNFLRNLKFGEEVDVLGPLGRFTLIHGDDCEELVFVATGSGIAPFRSMILNLLQDVGEKRPITLYWGLRYVEDLFWENEFQDLVENYENFKFHPVISRAIEEWPLCKGRVTDCLQVHDVPIKGGYYLCGSAKMIDDVNALIQERGVSKEDIHFEKFN
ncbi:MAG: hypothetical protein H6772_02805 [Pseudomonadales bacterium]|nr:hypothetical protein [Pseudomonadales bacterium]